MDESFYIGTHPASAFGAELLASYTVSGSAITQTYGVSRTGSHIIPCATLYGLRTITLPVDIYGDTPEDAAAKRSALTAAMLDGPVELYLPDGGIYTALLQSSGSASVWDDAGCLLTCTYTLAGYCHGPLENVQVVHDVFGFRLFAAGNAPQMECRLTVTARLWKDEPDAPDAPDTQSTIRTTAVAEEPFSVKIWYPGGGSCTVSGLHTGDTIIVDGIEKQILVNGANAFQNVTAISGWPTVTPGENVIPDDGEGPFWNTNSQYTVEYYPIFV